MRDDKNEGNSLCDVIILSLLYWCHGLSLFFVCFPSFELAFHWCLSRWRRVWCSNTHMILTNIHTKVPWRGGGGRGCCGLLLPFPTFGLWHTIKPVDMSGFHTWAQLNCRTSLVNSSSLHRRPVPSKLGSWWKKMSMGGADCFSIPAPAAPRAADKYGRQYIRVYNPRTYQNLALI